MTEKIVAEFCEWEKLNLIPVLEAINREWQMSVFDDWGLWRD